MEIVGVALLMVDRPTGEIYAGFMEEIKWRIIEVEKRLAVVWKGPDSKDRIFDVEFGFLQLRFICELIALASLVAHHSNGGVKRELLKKWHADQIFIELEEINRHCFPWPIRYTVDPDGIEHFVDRPEAAMTRSELKNIHGQCGNALHRGILKHALAGENRIYNVDQLNHWLGRVGDLLYEHSILFPNEERGVLVGMFGGPNQEVVVLQIEAEGPFEIQREAP